MHVIVLGGMARVGKTDVADYIEMHGAEEGFKVMRVSFATPLKEAVAKENGYDDWRKFKEEKPDLYRTQCQQIGAERRAENPDHWVNLWCEKLNYLMTEELTQNAGDLWEEYLIIVDDCRYPNELEAAKKFEALTMFVYAGSRVAEIPEANAAWRAHESEEMSQKVEAFLPDYQNLFDWSIFNDKDIKSLEAKLDERMPFILGLHGQRYGHSCGCNECRAFKADIQADELIAHFEEAIEEVLNDDSIPDNLKEQIEDAFTDIIDDLRDGKKAPMDFFRNNWWTKIKDMNFEIELENDEEEDDDD
jgi:hypothetical protein